MTFSSIFVVIQLFALAICLSSGAHLVQSGERGQEGVAAVKTKSNRAQDASQSADIDPDLAKILAKLGDKGCSVEKPKACCPYCKNCDKCDSVCGSKPDTKGCEFCPLCSLCGEHCSLQ